MAAYTGARYCITVASGTKALLISLMALGVGPGDEVITTPFTFVAKAELIVLLGAKPVFVDIEPDTCDINPVFIEEKITERTRVIMLNSLYGQPAYKYFGYPDCTRVAQQWARQVVSLPMSAGLDARDQRKIVHALFEVLK